jgi:hypothetical protein
MTGEPARVYYIAWAYVQGMGNDYGPRRYQVDREAAFTAADAIAQWKAKHGYDEPRTEYRRTQFLSCSALEPLRCTNCNAPFHPTDTDGGYCPFCGQLPATASAPKDRSAIGKGP